MLIYLIRHGETDWNVKQKMQGNSDIPLNAHGIEEAERAAEGLTELSFDRGFSSTLIRAKRTAEIIAKGRGLTVETDPRLVEVCFGMMEGMYIPLLKSIPFGRAHTYFHAPERYLKPVPGGETILAVQERSRSFFGEVLRPLENECGSVLVASHGSFIRATLSWITNTPLTEFRRKFRQKNCGVSLVELKDGEFRLLWEGRTFDREHPAGKPEAV